MKTILAALALMLSHGALAQDPGDTIFAGVQVHTINLRFPQARYWDSLTVYYAQGNEQYILASAIVDGVAFDSIGVRLKGNASYGHPNNKKSIRLSFDEYRDAQRWDGIKGIHLNNCWGDPTFMREKLHLDFCRDAGITAPRANFARVLFNDTLFAFYSMVEHVDKTFLGSRFGDSSGDLFKAVDGFGASSGYFSDFRWFGALDTAYANRYELKTEGSLTGWPQLVTVLDTINNNTNTSRALLSKIDLGSLYRAMAADVLFANLDSYINSSRNFYFYFYPPTRKMEWIVWDTGLSFGSFTGGVSNLENLSITYVSSATQRPLWGKVVNTPVLRNEYLQNFCQIYNWYFSSTRLFPHIDSVANAIRAYVTEDLRKMYTTQQFETNIVSDINASGGGGTRKPGLKSFITLRQANVQIQLTNLGVNCALSVLPGDIVINEFMAQNDSILDPAGEAEDWIELFNNTADTVQLDGMYLSDDPTVPTKWQFPSGTSMLPGAFLVVWADEDSGQAGLHANFKLSQSGEHIRLSNVDAGILDTISFGSQTANLSMARVPNGTGSFFQSRQTFNAPNTNSAVVTSGVLTTTLLPRFIEGINGTNANRIPFAYRTRLSGLLPNATYRFTNQIVTSADAVTTNGAGNCIFVQQSGDFVRTTSPSLATAGAYGSFTTDGAGTYDGWFVSEPTGNARFVPGKYVFMRIALNDGTGGTTAAMRLTTSDSVRVVKLDGASADSTGTGLRCTSSAGAKDFVFVYDNTAGTGRPIAGSFVESDGTDNSSANSYAAFYANNVNGVDGAFGVVLPNLLPNGIRRVERRALVDGALLATATDADGVWPSGARTINPSGGTTAIVLSGTDVSLVTDVHAQREVPVEYALEQNFPNPFNPSTVIKFRLPVACRVQLGVFDLVGREVAVLVDGQLNAGFHSATFNAPSLSSGIYLYRMVAGSFVQTRRMMLIK